jgi:hypothetical protein
MSSKIYAIIGILGMLSTGAMLAISSQQLIINQAALNHSQVFTGERLFSEALDEAGFRTRARVGNTGVGTWYYSGMAKFSQAREVHHDPAVDNLETLKKFGEILQAKLLDLGVSGEGGLSVVYNNSPREVKFRFHYTIRDRVGEIDVLKIGNNFFYTHSETTNIRNF